MVVSGEQGHMTFWKSAGIMWQPHGLQTGVSTFTSMAKRLDMTGMPEIDLHLFYIISVKERLLALVRDLFTFSSKVIKMFILV
jgi:hypothetical protein